MDILKPTHASSGTNSITKSRPVEQNPLRRHMRHVVQDGEVSKIAHTITACCRCRNRKTRCDPGLPRCGPCERSNASCEYVDTGKGEILSRSYIVYLQNKVQKLEDELRNSTNQLQDPPDAEVTMRKAGFVKFNSVDEPRLLGPSSGIGMTRLVMALAKHNLNTHHIKDIIPDTKARQIKDRFTLEDRKPTSKIYPLISDVAAPHLPSRELTDSLVQAFNDGPQYLLPTLHEPSFRKVVDDVFRGDGDSYKNFSLRMVIAISMQKLSPQYAGLADSYYLASLPFLERTIRRMNIETLQSLALMAQYSMVTPTRTAAYWVVGLAVRLCQEMGICEETTIAASDSQNSPLDMVQIDMRRRLFWIITSMEFGLAHSLGRPSCAAQHSHIDVKYFATVDDEYITPSGIISGKPLSSKKLVSIHFFKMRLLQAEIRRKIYLKQRSRPKDDQDPWFMSMERKMKDWLDSCPKSPEGIGLNNVWFKARYNTMVIFLHRPSPQIPKPSVRSVHQLFEAAVANIGLQEKQIATEPVVTWIWTQSLFLALNTTLFCLSYREIRDRYGKQEVETHVHAARNAIFIASQRWPGVESAIELYDNLIAACLMAYNENGTAMGSEELSPTENSFGSSPQEASSPPSVSNTVNYCLPFGDDHDGLSTRLTPGTKQWDPDRLQSSKRSPDSEAESSFSKSAPSIGSPEYDYPLQYQTDHFNPSSVHNAFPTCSSAALPDAILYPDDNSSYGPLTEYYSQYLQVPYILQQPLQALGQQEQMELMQDLETAGLRKG